MKAIAAKSRSLARSSASSTTARQSGMHGGWMSLGPRTVAIACLAMAAIVIPVVISLSRGAAPAAAGDSRDVARFDRQVRQSLSPMLVHVRALPQALKDLVTTADVSPNTALATQATQWADDSATARDLVRRLRPPAVAQGAVVQRIYVDGEMLYTEAARAAAQAASTPASRPDIARSGLRLLLLGDRMFDLGRRLLHRDEPTPDSETWVLPAAVPDFAKEGLDPDRPGALVAGGSGFESANMPTVADGDWLSRHGRSIDSALDTLVEVRPLLSPGHRDPANLASADAGRRLIENVSSNLAQPVPTSSDATEGVRALRLALLADAESLEALHWSGGDASEPLRLRLIGQQMWLAGTSLMTQSGIPAPPERVMTDPDVYPELLLAGGRFNGHPPALQPGQDPGAGVPGGLPNVDLKSVANS